MPNRPIFAHRLVAAFDTEKLDWFTDPKNFKNYQSAVELKRLLQEYNKGSLFSMRQHHGKTVFTFDETAEKGYVWNWKTGEEAKNDEMKLSYYTVQVFGRKSSFFKSAYNYGFRLIDSPVKWVKDSTKKLKFGIPKELEDRLHELQHDWKKVSIRAHEFNKGKGIWTLLREKYRPDSNPKNRIPYELQDPQLLKQLLIREGLPYLWQSWKELDNDEKDFILESKTFEILIHCAKDWPFMKDQFLSKHPSASSFSKWLAKHLKKKMQKASKKEQKGRKGKKKVPIAALVEEVGDSDEDAQDIENKEPVLQDDNRVVGLNFSDEEDLGDFEEFAQDIANASVPKEPVLPLADVHVQRKAQSPIATLESDDSLDLPDGQVPQNAAIFYPDAYSNQQKIQAHEDADAFGFL